MNGELEKARAAEPAWDEVRERRVLTRVIAARDEGARRARRGRAMMAVAAVAAVVVVVLFSRGAPSAREVSETTPVAAEPAGGRLALHDGSIVELSEGAEVAIVTDAATEVRIDHAAGEARYVVSHVPTRTFVVACGAVDVIVRGTRFVVRREGSRVDVDVEEGRVEVRRGGESTMLVRGETLRVDGTITPEAPAPTPPASTASADVAPIEPAIAHATSPRPTTTRAPTPSVEELLAEASAARRERRWDDAARALRAAIDASEGDPRAATYAFMLARVERSRGQDGAAADAFADAYARDPDAVLAEDALAESVVSLAAAGRTSEARAAAARYGERFPEGAYAERVRAAVDR